MGPLPYLRRISAPDAIKRSMVIIAARCLLYICDAEYPVTSSIYAKYRPSM